MIRLQQLHKRYRDGDTLNHVLRGVDLHVTPGELVALMGASGSGKTTLLNVIGGLDQDYEGTVTVDGQELGRLNDGALSRFRNRTVSFIFQQFHLLPHLPVLHNVAMPSWFDPARSDAAFADQARAVLERVGLGHKLHAQPNHLSGGEKQRVAIARAIFNDPRVLLCDEPTGSLDTDHGARVLSVFRELHDTGDLTVVIVTHNPQVAAACDRTVTVRDGVVVGDTGQRETVPPSATAEPAGGARQATAPPAQEAGP